MDSYDETVATVDENGNVNAVGEGYTMISALADNGIYVTCTIIVEEASGVTISEDVKIEGYQISITLGGSRVVGSVEPEINGQAVAKWGFVYALESDGITSYSVSDDDIVVGSRSKYVVSYESTMNGTLDETLGESETATYFVRTMLFSKGTAREFSAEYKVRAYALLDDGTYVYSDIETYTVYDVCNYLYSNSLMATAERHDYVYNNILKVVNKDYAILEYNPKEEVV